MTIVAKLKWWWRHLVVRRLNGEHQAARDYDRTHHLGKYRATRRERLHRWLWWKNDAYEDWLLDRGLSSAWYERLTIEEDGWIQSGLCWLLGHNIIEDHCGKPEHDYCLYCRTRHSGGAGNVEERLARIEKARREWQGK